MTGLNVVIVKYGLDGANKMKYACIHHNKTKLAEYLFKCDQCNMILIGAEFKIENS
jgi:hypothetical protein